MFHDLAKNMRALKFLISTVVIIKMAIYGWWYIWRWWRCQVWDVKVVSIKYIFSCVAQKNNKKADGSSPQIHSMTEVVTVIAYFSFSHLLWQRERRHADWKVIVILVHFCWKENGWPVTGVKIQWETWAYISTKNLSIIYMYCYS